MASAEEIQNAAHTAKTIKLNDSLNGFIVSRKIWALWEGNDYEVFIHYLDTKYGTESQRTIPVTLEENEQLDDFLNTGDEVLGERYTHVISVSYNDDKRVISRFISFRTLKLGTPPVPQ